MNKVFMICTTNQVKENWIGGAYGTYRQKIRTGVWSGNLKESNNFGPGRRWKEII